jgi:hypothetical protein
MSNTIKPNPPGVTNFDKISKDMNKEADVLKDAAKNTLADAGASVNRAGGHAADAFVNLSGAAANALFATGKTVEGVANTAAAAGHLGAAGGLATLGAAAWTTEEVRSGGRFAARGAARGFAGIANAFSRILGDGKSVTVRELAGDPKAIRFSEKMMGEAGKQLNKSSDAMNAAWGSYVGAITNLAGSAVNLGMAAGHTAAVAGNLALAAAQAGAAAPLKLAEYGVRLGSAAVQAAEQGVVGARELAILSAKLSAATANVLANPDQGKVEVSVKNTLNEYNAELRRLVAANPGLGQVTAQVAGAQ